MHIKTVAYLFKVGFFLKLFQKEQIILWFEQEILDGNSDPLIIEFPFLYNRSDAEILSNLSDIYNPIVKDYRVVSDNYFLGYVRELFNIQLHRQNYLPLEQLLVNYYSIISLDFDLSEDEKTAISIFNNDLSLRISGLPAPMEMPQDAIEHVNNYQEFNELDKIFTGRGVFITRGELIN